MTFVSAVDDALRLSERRTQISAVHDVVRNGLRAVAPTVAIRTTDYFTHSFVPDLILEWGPDDRRQHRHVHLRFLVSDPPFLSELSYLASTEPMFIGLLDSEPIADVAQGANGSPGVAETLITQSQSIDALQEGKARDQRAVTATREVVRGGRGALGPERATEVVGAYHETLTAIELLDTGQDAATEQTQTALGVLRSVLRPRFFNSIERELRSRWIRQGGDPFQFPGAAEWDPQTLTHEELGEVLNALLDCGRDVDADVWTRNAWFLSAQELAEALGSDRRGGALNRLAAAMLPSWTAQWVWAETLELPLQPTFDWMIKERTLAIEIGDMRASFRDDGRRFKDKAAIDEPLPSISDISEMLSDPNVQAASFRSPTEDIAYSYHATGEQVLYDRLVEVFETSQREALRVSEIHTLVPSRDDVAEIDLARRIIDLDKTPTPISILIRLALTYFHHADYRSADIDHFLRTGEPPEPPVADDGETSTPSSVG
ncbi:MAG: hypothetical protein ACRDJX_03080 [Solirubrobacteraceae bacterium]